MNAGNDRTMGSCRDIVAVIFTLLDIEWLIMIMEAIFATIFTQVDIEWLIRTTELWVHAEQSLP